MLKEIKEKENGGRKEERKKESIHAYRAKNIYLVMERESASKCDKSLCSKA